MAQKKEVHKHHKVHKKVSDEDSKTERCCNNLDIQRVSLAMGFFGATSVMFLSLANNLFGLGHPIIGIVASLYKGFNSTLPGTIFGMLWGFVDFYFGGLVFSFFYNKVGKCRKCSKKE